MPFSPRGLSRLAIASDGGVSLWSYATDDPAGALAEKGYFNAAAPMLGLGDRIFAMARMGTPVDLAVTYRSKNVIHAAVMAAPVR